MGRAIQRGAGRLGAVIGVSVLGSLAIGGGMVLLVVPGVYLALRLATAVPATAVEGDGVFESLRRAWARANGYLVHTLTVLLLLLLVYLVFVFAIGLVAGIGGALAGGFRAGAGARTLLVVVQAVTAVMTAALYPLLTK